MIGILGDIHAGFNGLRRAHDRALAAGAVALIQVGDFGFYAGAPYKLNAFRFTLPIYVIDGNHDNFAELREVKPGEIMTYAHNVFYVSRGTLLVIDSKRIAFLGGAGSIDKDIRIKEGWLWQPDEQITAEDVRRACALPKPIDLMITHCPPQATITKYFETPEKIMFKTQAFGVAPDWSDPSALMVEKVWEELGKPPLICGHMHESVVDDLVRILNIDELILI